MILGFEIQYSYFLTMYTFSGIVIHGNKRGRLLGFPTANIPLSQEIPEGIYVSYIIIESTSYPSLTFIGSAKTFNEQIYQAETYIFNFDQNIYDKEVSVELLEKLRDNEKFISVEHLVKQMEEDKKNGEKYFADIPPSHH